MPTSQNGWPVVTDPNTLTPLSWVTGRVRSGAVHAVFNELCRRFNAEVENITKAHSWGWAYRPVRGASGGYSNHASGTAIDLNAPRHPLGAGGTFTPHQANVIRGILKDLGGVIRWGGDYQNRADAMHFEVNATAAAVAKVAARITGKTQPKPIQVRLRHCSMQFSDPRRQKAADARAAFVGLPHVVTFTEVGKGQNNEGQALLRAEATRRGYSIYFDGYEGGIAVRFTAGHVIAHGYEGPIVKGKAGDHPHLGLAWVTVTHRALGTMTFGVTHWLNRDSERARAKVNNALTKTAGDFLARKATGDALAFLAGDTNRDDRRRDVLVGIPYKTCWDELGIWPATLGTRTVDMIASHDKDLRVRCIGARTLPRAHSDHRQIEAVYAITPIGVAK